LYKERDEADENLQTIKERRAKRRVEKAASAAARKEFDYSKRTGKSAQGHDESVCLHKQRDEADENLQAIKESCFITAEKGRSSEG